MDPIATHLVDYRDGQVYVRDYGGSGPSVLCVATMGSCAPCWDLVAARLVETCRVLSMDPPGHAQSTAELASHDDVWESIAQVVDELALESPLLVGHDHASSFVAQAALAHPQLARGIVAVGGSLARSTDDMLEIIELISLPEVLEGLGERFGFGARAHDEAELARLIDEAAARIAGDGITAEHGGLERELRHSFLRRDGVWIRRPEMSAFLAAADQSVDDPLFSDERMVQGLQVPAWLVQLHYGDEALHAARERELAAQLDHVRIVELQTGQWPQYTTPDELARVIAAAAHDPWGDPPPVDAPADDTQDARHAQGARGA